jgi:hypothetical protein
MSDSRPYKPDSSNTGGAPEDNEERRRSDERNQQEDLNQGMTTGTHDSTRSGVDWGDSYKNLKETRGKTAKGAPAAPPGKSNE